ncbi:DNA cytosine methyltransferase [Micromonospora tulbaghiae]|uniref:DNA cytosine methyltransferase n=1 Tax=Micromonospora tulbaghiae TaxID=479978 RepID=UPI0036528515
MWSAVADAVRVLRPPLVFVENVAALLRRGFDVVEADLAAIGYDTSWTCLRASDIGAAHRRDRLFLLAAPAGRVGGGADVADTVRP